MYSWQQVAKVIREFFGEGDMAEEILRLRDENATALAEIDRLRAEGSHLAERQIQVLTEKEMFRSTLAGAHAEIDRLRRILAALREPSEGVVDAANTQLFRAEQVWDHNVKAGLRAAVTAAEQEVGNE